jgi:hypothetical protein
LETKDRLSFVVAFQSNRMKNEQKPLSLQNNKMGKRERKKIKNNG